LLRVAQTQPPPQSKGPRGMSDEWQPIETAPTDGTRVLLWCVHPNAEFSPDPVAEGWAAAVVGEWIDHNGGGWTWHGLLGRMTHWRPLPPPPKGGAR
jgi:hypothetical protein